MLNKQELKRELGALLASTKAQLANNLRLRLGAWLCLGIILLQPIWWLQETRNNLTAELTQLLEKEAKILRTSNEQEWFSREQQTNELKTHLFAKIAPADSLGIAQATLQNWLTEISATAKLKNSRVTIDEPSSLDNIPNTYRVSARLDAIFDEQGALTFLENLEQHPSFLVIERAELGQLGQTRMIIYVAAYFKLTTASAEH
jgi:hypothetical protein